MTRVNPHVNNFLYRNDQTALVVVKMDSHGNPDSVSYWKNLEGARTKRHEGVYEVGVLVNMWV